MALGDPNTFEFDPYSRIVDSDPFPLYKELRDNHPCYWSESGDCWVLTRYADIADANQKWEVFSSQKGNMLDDMPERAGNTLGTTDPPRHDHLRTLVQAAFGRRNIEYLKEPIESIAHELLDRVASKKSFDFISEFSSPVTIEVLSKMLGIGTDDTAEVRKNVVNFLQTNPETRQKTDSQVQSFEWLKTYAGAQVKDRKDRIAAGEPTDDLITALIEAEIDGDKLLDSEVLMTTLTLVMAGLESGSSFLAMMGYNLAMHEQARSELVGNHELVGPAVEESLRYNTSAQRFRRTLTQEYELHGQTMKAGDKVLMCYGAANRDERKFPDPDIYDVHRNPRQHLGLGVGKHVCLGAQLARLLSKFAMIAMLERYPNFHLANPDVAWIASCTFRSPVRLEIATG